MTPRTCFDCRRPLRTGHTRRGLCEHPCYDRRYRNGTHLDLPATYRRRADLIADWHHLAAHGHTRAQAAARLGIPKNTLDKAISRARRAEQTT